MDEEIIIIDANTRNEKIKNFFLNNKKNLIIVMTAIVLALVLYFSFSKIKERNKIKLANEFNLVKINYKENQKQKSINKLVEIINKNDVTYSPLALYFLLDNNLIDDNTEINKLFDKLINEINLDTEIKNLIIYKKALFNSDFTTENNLLKILNPIINSESIWKSHSLYLLAEFFYSKNEKQKAKDFFNQIIILSNGNSDIKIESQKRLNRDLGE